MAPQPQTPQTPPNPARIAMWSFLLGVLIWVGGACIYLGIGHGGGGPKSPASRAVATAISATAVAVAPTATPPLPDRTSCDAIRGTDYRSDKERDFFRANCS